MLVGGEHAEGDRLVRGAFDLARAAHADAMPVREKLRHHHRVIRRVAAPAVVVRVEDRGQVQRLYRLAHEVRQMALGEPVVQARRHQRRLVGVIRTEVSLVFHARHYSMAVKWYSDRLLAPPSLAARVTLWPIAYSPRLPLLAPPSAHHGFAAGGNHQQEYCAGDGSSCGSARIRPARLRVYPDRLCQHPSCCGWGAVEYRPDFTAGTSTRGRPDGQIHNRLIAALFCRESPK